MFSFKVSCAVLLSLVSVARATLTITDQELHVNSTELSTVKWSSSNLDQDPESFTIELINKVFNSQFALGNNVPTSSGQFQFSMPQVLADDNYSLELVQNGNINTIFAQIGPFSIGGSVSVASPPGGTTTTGTTSTKTGTGTGTGTGTTTATGTSGQNSTSVLSTISQTASSVRTSPTAPSAGSSGLSGTATTAGAAPAATTTNASAAGPVPAGSFAALVAVVVALLF